jgi:hypothetical protein
MTIGKTKFLFFAFNPLPLPHVEIELMGKMELRRHRLAVRTRDG